MGWMTVKIKTDDHEVGDKYWVGPQVYTYVTKCLVHGITTNDFVGKTDNGYIFRCTGGKADKGELIALADLRRHTFAAVSVTCYREWYDTPNGRVVAWQWDAEQVYE